MLQQLAVGMPKLDRTMPKWPLKAAEATIKPTGGILEFVHVSPLLDATFAQTHIELQADQSALRGQNWAPFAAQGTPPA